MNSLIKETNENLKAIVDTLKENRDNSITTLDNIQLQMDKKVEEAKKYKIQVDSAKEKIKQLEDENKSLELSLSELSDKYGKMNLVSVVEAGNREIKLKINDNIKEINVEKEHIADLTNKARTIKDLLINLKKDKTLKEERLEKIKIVYEYYNERISDIVDYAFNHAENLSDYKSNVSFVNYNYEDEETDVSDESKSFDLENTMVFDEIANIDENKNFKDEMSFIDEQINDALDTSDEDKNKYEDIIDRSLNNEVSDLTIDDENKFIDETYEEEKNIELDDSTPIFDSIFDSDIDDEDAEDESEGSLIEPEYVEEENNDDVVENNIEEDNTEVTVIEEVNDSDEIEVIKPLEEEDNAIFNNLITPVNIDDNEDDKIDREESGIEDDENRINQINDLFSSFQNTTKVSLENVDAINSVENKIDNAYMDVFGKPLDEESLNKKDPTLTDIFGNPIKSDELSEDVKISKKLEDLFLENGIDFNKFREDEKNYLKQIYDEEKFNNILNTLKKNKINLDNVYNAFNIFGEISANELENLISKLLNVGQSVEAIGVVLEKLPKVKKYNLDEAIISYGDYVKDIDITELIMKAKELYKNGGNN